MRRSITALFFVAVTFLALISTIILAEGEKKKKNPIITLDNVADLESKVNGGKNIWVLQFTKSAGCPECETLLPQFEKAAGAMQDMVKFATITNDEIAAKFEVKQFPSYKIFSPAAVKGGKSTVDDYTGDKNADGLVKAAVAAVKTLVNTRSPNKKAEEEINPKKQAAGMFENTEVVELDDNEFEQQVLNGKDAHLVMFFAPWCGHCKNLKPAWIVAAAAGTGIRVAAVDATAHTKYSNKYGVQGFPTIKFFKPSDPEQTPEDYNGGRTEQAIISYLEGKAAEYGKGTPVVVNQVENQEALEEKCLKDKLLCVVFVLPHVAFTGAAGRNQLLEMLGKVVSKFRNRNTGFGWISGGDHGKFESAFGVQDNYPTFVAFGNSKGQIKYSVPKAEKFELEEISSHLDKVLGGRKSMYILKGATEVPKLTKNVALWDGKDYVESDE